MQFHLRVLQRHLTWWWWEVNKVIKWTMWSVAPLSINQDIQEKVKGVVSKKSRRDNIETRLNEFTWTSWNLRDIRETLVPWRIGSFELVNCERVKASNSWYSFWERGIKDGIKRSTRSLARKLICWGDLSFVPKGWIIVLKTRWISINFIIEYPQGEQTIFYFQLCALPSVKSQIQSSC